MIGVRRTPPGDSSSGIFSRFAARGGHKIRAGGGYESRRLLSDRTARDDACVRAGSGCTGAIARGPRGPVLDGPRARRRRRRDVGARCDGLSRRRHEHGQRAGQQLPGVPRAARGSDLCQQQLRCAQREEPSDAVGRRRRRRARRRADDPRHEHERRNLAARGPRVSHSQVLIASHSRGVAMMNRPRIWSVIVLLVAATLGAPSAALAQRTTTGTVIGKIADSSGAVLPGVTVVLTSPEALGQFTAVTDGQGQYRVTNLPPATYDVRAELSGFQTVIRKAPVRLNAVTEVDFTLSVGAVAETVNVTAETPIVDPERAGLSVNINNQALTNVPVTTNRRFQDAWLVVPGVAVNPATQELTGSERRTSLDGADVTDPYGGDIFAVNLNYDAIQDVEVKALGSEASDGSSMVGQYMNIVTKSGGNQFHGSAALFAISHRFND